MNIWKTKTAEVAGMILAGLLFLGAIVVTIQGQVQAGSTMMPAIPEDAVSPFDYHVSADQPASVRAAENPDLSQDVNLSVDVITLSHYDVYYTDEACVLALRMVPQATGADLRAVFLGLQLRGRKTGIGMSSGGGRLSAFFKNAEASPFRKDPFTIWVTFNSASTQAMTALNGAMAAEDVIDPLIEVYLSPRSAGGITFTGDGDGADVGLASPHILIRDLRAFERKTQ